MPCYSEHILLNISIYEITVTVSEGEDSEIGIAEVGIILKVRQQGNILN
jgi:hypothetical protein